jgi:hypothetical protein
MAVGYGDVAGRDSGYERCATDTNLVTDIGAIFCSLCVIIPFPVFYQRVVVAEIRAMDYAYTSQQRTHLSK